MTLCGELRYGPFTPAEVRFDGAAGGAARVPGTPGGHQHGPPAGGRLLLNGRRIDFTGGTGFIETVRGTDRPFYISVEPEHLA